MALWIEKYRPQTLSDVCLDDETRTYFEQFEDEIPHLLFVSEAGRGKTTMARILVKDILKCDYHYINASDKNGIDTIRSEITGFVQTKSFDGGIKVVILDEADGLSPEAQRSLRNLMEEYSDSARFILTANYKHKIITPLVSRCTSVAFNIPIKDVVRRCVEILKNENVKFSADANLINFIKGTYPDIRLTISSLQKNVINGVLQLSEIDDNSELLNKVYNDCSSGNVLNLREYLIQNYEEFDNDYEQLLRDFLNLLYSKTIDESKKKNAICVLADGIYKNYFVVDKEINAFACLLAVEDVLS